MSFPNIKLLHYCVIGHKSICCGANLRLNGGLWVVAMCMSIRASCCLYLEGELLCFRWMLNKLDGGILLITVSGRLA